MILLSSLLLGAAYLVGHRAGTRSLEPADVSHFRALYELGEAGRSAPLSPVVDSDDEQVRLATVLLHTIAGEMSVLSFMMLTDADDAPLARMQRGDFARSSDTSLSTGERDEAFRDECAQWADRVLQVTSPQALAELSEPYRALSQELGVQSAELGTLCTGT